MEYIGGTSDNSEVQLGMKPLLSPRAPAAVDHTDLSMSLMSQYDVRRQVSQLIRNNRCFKWGHGQHKPARLSPLSTHSRRTRAWGGWLLPFPHGQLPTSPLRSRSAHERRPWLRRAC